MVTEFAPRGALSVVLADESIEMDYDMAVQFALDAAEGMKYLHGLRKPVVSAFDSLLQFAGRSLVVRL